MKTTTGPASASFLLTLVLAVPLAAQDEGDMEEVQE